MIDKVKTTWQIKRFERQIQFKKNFDLFNKIYRLIDQQQKLPNLHPTQLSLTYGEIEFRSFAALLSLVKPQSNDTFIDLGSGNGKACFVAALSFNIDKCIGIEIVEQRHQQAIAALSLAPPKLTEKIHFICDDFLKQPIEQASIIFINATAFFNETWQEIELYLQQVKPGTRLLISTKKLSQQHFKYQGCKLVNMSYGPSHVHLYQKN